MNRLSGAPSRSAVILWGGEFALEVPHVDCRLPLTFNRDKLRYPSDLTDAVGRIRAADPIGLALGCKRRVASAK